MRNASFFRYRHQGIVTLLLRELKCPHHIALITIAKKSVARQTASLCTRVKLDLVCLYPTDSQMWSSNSLRVIFPCNKTPGFASSEFVLTLRFLWIFPFPASSASQSLHMNRYLVKTKPASVRLRWNYISWTGCCCCCCCCCCCYYYYKNFTFFSHAPKFVWVPNKPKRIWK